MTFLPNDKIQFADSPSTDAFGRARVAEPTTIFDSKQIFDNQPLFWDDQQTSGSGTSSTHSANAARSRLAVSATTAGKRTRQTFERHNYQPGKSQLILMTGVMNSAGSGLTMSVGAFDNDHGLFFSNIDGTMNVVCRSNVTGSPVDSSIAQNSWNLDIMDGSGKSGVTLDFSKTQIFVFDYEWLGVGRVRFGFNIDGVTIYCHEFKNANNLDVVYMSTPNIPLRYEIENDGTGGAASLDAICASVTSEGGSQDNGLVRCVTTGGTHLDANTENTKYALIGIRLKTTHLGETIKLINAEFQIQTASDKILWEILWNPTVAGTFTYSDLTNSAIQRALGATANTVTGGTPIAAGFIESGGAAAGGAGSGGGIFENALKLGAAIDGTRDEIVLTVQPVAGSTSVDIEGSLAWREMS